MGDHNNPYRPVGRRKLLHVQDEDTWRKNAACLAMPTDLWFGGQNDLQQAKKVCADCPVKLECLSAAMEEERGFTRFGRHGIRGGLTGHERSKLARKMREI